jgi:hypothetical protein
MVFILSRPQSFAKNYLFIENSLPVKKNLIFGWNLLYKFRSVGCRISISEDLSLKFKIIWIINLYVYNRTISFKTILYFKNYFRLVTPTCKRMFSIKSLIDFFWSRFILM